MSSSTAYMETPAATMRLAFPKPPDPSLGTPNLFVLNDLLQYMCKCAQTHKSPISKRMNLLYVAIDNKTIEHDQAAERLITKLILDPTLVGTQRNNERAKLIDAFMEEYGDFTNKRGMFARDNIWIMAADKNAKAC